MSHYDYLEQHLNDFWIAVRGKPLDNDGCAGIISAHGDKGYQYRDFWEKAGIHFYHGMMLYMLTYTSELGDTPKWESRHWVVDNYPKYKSVLPIINDR